MGAGAGDAVGGDGSGDAHRVCLAAAAGQGPDEAPHEGVTCAGGVDGIDDGGTDAQHLTVRADQRRAGLAEGHEQAATHPLGHRPEQVVARQLVAGVLSGEGGEFHLVGDQPVRGGRQGRVERRSGGRVQEGDRVAPSGGGERRGRHALGDLELPGDDARR